MAEAPIPSGSTQLSPVDDFSQCHVGILAHLQALDELPGLLAAAARARSQASTLRGFFEHAVLEHHQQEEEDLFPAVLASAHQGAERELVQAMVLRLTTEHRQIEAAWARLDPALKAAAKGQASQLAAADVHALVEHYQTHAGYEEAHFLPLAKTILGRDDHHMAALGLSLHMRQALPATLQRFGTHI
jgi:hemerythrin-like domain-containing protein